MQLSGGLQHRAHSHHHLSSYHSHHQAPASAAAAACALNHHAAAAAAQQRRPHAAPSRRSRQHVQAVHAIHIDRRQHMELAWKRQQAREELLSEAPIHGKVIELQDLQHLDSLVDKAGSSLLFVFLYTRSCGVCKALLQDYQALCEEAKQQKVSAVFARHNLLDEFDFWSDISVWYRIRAPPTVLIYDEGAVVRRITLHDVRRMGERAGSIREAMVQDLSKMKTIFRQIVFEKAPGARS